MAHLVEHLLSKASDWRALSTSHKLLQTEKITLIFNLHSYSFYNI